MGQERQKVVRNELLQGVMLHHEDLLETLLGVTLKRKFRGWGYKNKFKIKRKFMHRQVGSGGGLV